MGKLVEEVDNIVIGSGDAWRARIWGRFAE